MNVTDVSNGRPLHALAHYKNVSDKTILKNRPPTFDRVQPSLSYYAAIDIK